MRLIDIAISTIGLIILSPIFLLIALYIKLDSAGPIFYRAKRVGKAGQIFWLYKFRSMVTNADKRGPAITGANDARITTCGRFLRNKKLDELPQLLNVLKGEMSLVGPRPEDPHYVALYNMEQKQILAVRPGITSAASLAYRNEQQILSGSDWETTYRQVILPKKLQIDLAYLSKRTIWSDIMLIMQTIVAMFR